MSRMTRFFLLGITPLLALVLAALGAATLATNPLGWFLLAAGIIFTGGMVIVYYIRRIRFWESSLDGDTAQQERGDRSFGLIALSLAAATFLPPIEYLFFPLVPCPPWMSACGLGLVVPGAALFVWARRTLRRCYAGHLTVKTGQPLVQGGPYRRVRHPAYAGYLLMVLGTGLGYASLAGALAVLLLVLPALIYRMNVEERLLVEHFGDEYRRYADRTRRLIPGIW